MPFVNEEALAKSYRRVVIAWGVHLMWLLLYLATHTILICNFLPDATLATPLAPGETSP